MTTDDPGDPASASIINDLDLYFLPRGSFDEGQAEALSISIDSTVDHIFFQVPTTDEYEFWVFQHDADVGTNQNYAVAWWAASASLVAEGDFNNDGMIDGSDFAQWTGDFGETTGGDSDADNDGDSDGADFLAWQRGFGKTSVVPANTPVPEPAALMLAVIGLPVLVRRRVPA
jgi:hypothetical protein